MKKEGEIKDVYQELTNLMVGRMEESKATGWVKPWITCSALPVNPVTGTKYRGGNAVNLMTAGFDDNRWFTFKGALDYGQKAGTPMCVRKGSKGIAVYKAVQMVVSAKGEETEHGDKRQFVRMVHSSLDETTAKSLSRSFMRMVYAGTVFNGTQIEGLEPYQARENKVVDHAEVELLAKALQARAGLKIEHSLEGRAYFSPGRNLIHMPNKELFRSTEAYYSTLAHEMTHASGVALERNMAGAFGSADYAFEELVAELGSYFLGAELGCGYDPSTHEQHAAYMESWLQALKNDKKMIFKAASLAGKSCDYNMEHQVAFKEELGLVASNRIENVQKVEKALSGAKRAEPTVAPVMRM